MKNERTSKSIASDAADVMNAKPVRTPVNFMVPVALWEAARRVAASCLTQAPDTKRKRKKS